MLDMSNSNVEAVTSFVEEVIDETVGRSSKKWALVLLALAAGALVALWLTRGSRSAETGDQPA